MSELFTREIPEKAGLCACAVKRMMDKILSLNITMHGLLLVSKGRVIAEANWVPFCNNNMHRMYSVSKSFVSMAVGCLIGEGKLRLEDEVYRFFPDKVPENMHPYLKEATVRDLLMMATPHSEQSYTVKDRDWVRTFFSKKPSHPAGTFFSYDTAGTVVLCTIVERLTGTAYTEYLRSRLFDPIGASKNISCIKTPEGTSWGGSGMLCSLYDMAKSAYVCMHHGQWDGRQLLPADYIDAAISKQIDNSSIGGEGYGYQIWRLKRNGFAFIGMGGQYAYCFPDEDLLFACTADNQSDPEDHSRQLQDAVYELVDSLHADKIWKMDTDTGVKMGGNTSIDLFTPYKDLTLPLPAGNADSSWKYKIDGKWYYMEPNPMGIQKLRVRFQKKEGFLEYEKSGERKIITFGIRSYRQGEFPELYFDRQIGVIGKRHYRCLAAASWTEENKLYVRVCIADIYFGGLQIMIAFKGEQVGLHMTKVAEWFLDDYQGFAGGTAEE